MKIGLLTCTGGREDTFRLTEKFMQRQTLPYAEWIVVDDVDPETPCTLGQSIIRPEPRWKKGSGHTICRNMAAGLEALLDLDLDLVFVIEDDDWYHPDYLAHMTSAFRDRFVRVVGERDTLYYHVGCRQWRKNWHPGHASLCATGFLAAEIPKILEIVNAAPSTAIDFRIFRSPWPQGSLKLLPTDYCIGMKGFPNGRGGIGSGHYRIPHSGIPDPDMSFLRSKIGDDADFYAGYFAPQRYPSKLTPETGRRPNRRPGNPRAKMKHPSRLTKEERAEIAQDRLIRLQRQRRRNQ